MALNLDLQITRRNLAVEMEKSVMAMYEKLYGPSTHPSLRDLGSNRVIPELDEIAEKVQEILWEHAAGDEVPGGAEAIAKYLHEVMAGLVGKINTLEQEKKTLEAVLGEAKPLTTYRGYRDREAEDASLVKDTYPSNIYWTAKAEAAKKFALEKGKRPPLPQSSPIHPAKAFK